MQGSNLFPLFPFHTNDFFEQSLNGQICSYVDGPCLMYGGRIIMQIENNIKIDMKLLENWCYNNLLTMNKNKTEYMIFANMKARHDI